MSKRLLIVGTSGYANEIALIVRRIDPDGAIWSPISYVATSRSEIGCELLFGRVDYCDEEVLSGSVEADAVIGLGDPRMRLRVTARYLNVPTLAFPNVIDPSVDFNRNLVAMGTGNVINRNVVMTFHIVMGDFNFISTCSIIGHDVRLGSYNTISPSATLLNSVRLGDACLIGAGASVMPKIKLADRTTLGACALLRHDILDAGQVFVGIPARRLR